MWSAACFANSLAGKVVTTVGARPNVNIARGWIESLDTDREEGAPDMNEYMLVSDEVKDAVKAVNRWSRLRRYLTHGLPQPHNGAIQGSQAIAGSMGVVPPPQS